MRGRDGIKYLKGEAIRRDERRREREERTNPPSPGQASTRQGPLYRFRRGLSPIPEAPSDDSDTASYYTSSSDLESDAPPSSDPRSHHYGDYSGYSGSESYRGFGSYSSSDNYGGYSGCGGYGNHSGYGGYSGYSDSNDSSSFSGSILMPLLDTVVATDLPVMLTMQPHYGTVDSYLGTSYCPPEPTDDRSSAERT
ncbi:hypothetical protein AKJ16_DCAP01583 [Drosera capensis]